MCAKSFSVHWQTDGYAAILPQGMDGSVCNACPWLKSGQSDSFPLMA